MTSPTPISLLLLFSALILETVLNSVCLALEYYRNKMNHNDCGLFLSVARQLLVAIPNRPIPLFGVVVRETNCAIRTSGSHTIRALYDTVVLRQLSIMAVGLFSFSMNHLPRMEFRNECGPKKTPSLPAALLLDHD